MPLRPFSHLCRLVTLPAAIALLFGACKGLDLTSVDVWGGRLTSISVTQGSVVEIGDTIRLEATGGVDGLAGMFLYDPLLDAVWTVSDPAIARLELLPPPPPEDSFPRARVLVRGLRQGQARVTASARGVSGEGEVRVIPAVDHITLRPPRDTLLVGDTIFVGAAVVDATGRELTGLPLRFDAIGSVRLNGYSGAGAWLIATASGRGVLTARFRRVTREAAFIVAARTP